MMKRLLLAAAVSTALFTSYLYADYDATQHPRLVATPDYEAQNYALLRNIDARLAELNLKLSAPQVQGCSDGERVYTEGLTVMMKTGSNYVCNFVNGRFAWIYVPQ